ncbi:MAG: CHAT domain-containing protein [Bacteroidota bacterium]
MGLGVSCFLTKLVFTPSQDTLYDNYLHNFELYIADMEAKMVVLSACSASDGELASGEGVKSMSQVFTYAGAESVVIRHPIS